MNLSLFLIFASCVFSSCRQIPAAIHWQSFLPFLWQITLALSAFIFSSRCYLSSGAYEVHCKMKVGQCLWHKMWKYHVFIQSILWLLHPWCVVSFISALPVYTMFVAVLFYCSIRGYESTMIAVLHTSTHKISVFFSCSDRKLHALPHLGLNAYQPLQSMAMHPHRVNLCLYSAKAGRQWLGIFQIGVQEVTSLSLCMDIKLPMR